MNATKIVPARPPNGVLTPSCPKSQPPRNAPTRAVRRLFVRRGLFEADDAQGMLAWPHSGFHVHDGVWVADGDMDFAKRLARCCARTPWRSSAWRTTGPVRARSARHCQWLAHANILTVPGWQPKRLDPSFPLRSFT